jgi:hypothetical protein
MIRHWRRLPGQAFDRGKHIDEAFGTRMPQLRVISLGSPAGEPAPWTSMLKMGEGR